MDDRPHGDPYLRAGLFLGDRAYVYSDTNMSFVFGDSPWATWTVRVVCVLSATVGALLSLDVVWNAVDIAMAVMTITNLVALVVLCGWLLARSGLPGAAQGRHR